MNLDNIEFLISSTILIGAIIPLYIYRKQIFKFAYKKGDLETFLKDLKLHMSKDHPKIRFEYGIVQKTKDEKDIRIRQTLIVEDIINQFFNYEYIKKTQKTVSSDKLWTGYKEKSKSNPKVPNDWTQRRKLAWERDNQCCNRCGCKTKFEDSHSCFVKEIENGGGYNLENIIVLCSDCNKILNSKNPTSTIASLQLNDRLMIFVES